MKTEAILHLDLDTFFVSCERLIDSKLLKRPLLVGGIGDRGVVAACSYETRKFGIHSGMSMKLARQLCPEATVIRGNSSTYTKHSQTVTEIIKERVPVFEKASIDEFYADLTGMDKFFGTYKFATELRNTIIKETGLPISFGFSQQKYFSELLGDTSKITKVEIVENFKKKFKKEIFHKLIRYMLTKQVHFGESNHTNNLTNISFYNAIQGYHKTKITDIEKQYIEKRDIREERLKARIAVLEKEIKELTA